MLPNQTRTKILHFRSLFCLKTTRFVLFYVNLWEDMGPLESQIFAAFLKFYSQATDRRFPVTFLIQMELQMDPESQNLP